MSAASLVEKVDEKELRAKKEEPILGEEASKYITESRVGINVDWKGLQKLKKDYGYKDNRPGFDKIFRKVLDYLYSKGILTDPESEGKSLIMLSREEFKTVSVYNENYTSNKGEEEFIEFAFTCGEIARKIAREFKEAFYANEKIYIATLDEIINPTST